jgi:hypothetical protein
MAVSTWLESPSSLQNGVGTLVQRAGELNFFDYRRAALFGNNIIPMPLQSSRPPVVPKNAIGRSTRHFELGSQQ